MGSSPRGRRRCEDRAGDVDVTALESRTQQSGCIECGRWPVSQLSFALSIDNAPIPEIIGPRFDAGWLKATSIQMKRRLTELTGTVCTGVASRIPGTVVHEMTRRETLDRLVVRIGHPAGVIETEACADMDGGGPVVRRATLGRTARRILEGDVFVPEPECS